MTVYAVIFYLLAGAVLLATGIAVTRRNLVHTVVYLIISFFGTAMLYYLFGAPLLAALEVIIYAGAMMVLFLFIVMMLKVDERTRPRGAWRRWLPAVCLGIIFLAGAILPVTTDPASHRNLELALATPRAFSRFVFRNYWLAVEIVSLLLLVSLIGALYLGRVAQREASEPKTSAPREAIGEDGHDRSV
jgi:NADH-quinone oxidoreductase subunit J